MAFSKTQKGIKFYSFFILLSLLCCVFLSRQIFADSSNISVTVTIFECSDDIDNDSDSLIDYPNDPGCDSVNDDDEYNAPPAPTGGGVGGASVPPLSYIIFEGQSFSQSKVFLLKDSQISTTTVAEDNGDFEIKISLSSPGNYIFSIYSEDRQKRTSALLTFPLYVSLNAIANVSEIFISPTLEIDKKEVKYGESIFIYGESIPNSEVEINIENSNTGEKIIFKTESKNDGHYLYQLKTSELKTDSYIIKARTISGNKVSSFSRALVFKVGEKTIFAEGGKCGPADLNCDGRVDLVDFSILLYWWEKRNSVIDQDGDGIIDMRDFSIMMYYWTG